MHNEPCRQQAATLRTIRHLLLAIVLIGCIGTIVELLLLAHDEDVLQLIPLALLSAAVLTLLWMTARPSAVALRLFQATMALCIAGGGLGLVLHFRANVEFQREFDPSLASMALFWKAMAAKAPPALAPGIMAQLGLVGLAYSYGHPARGRAAGSAREGDEDESIR